MSMARKQGRKGQQTLLLEAVVYVIIAVLILSILLVYAKHVGEQGPFERKKIAIDRSMTINKMLGSPMNIELVMPKSSNISEYYENNRVTISDGAHPTDNETYFFFPSKSTHVVESSIEPGRKARLLKEGVMISASPDGGYIPESIACVKPKLGNIEGLVIDPARGGFAGQFYSGLPADLGAVAPDNHEFTEAEFTLGIALQFSGAALTRSAQSRVGLNERLEVVRRYPYAAILGFRAGNYSSDVDPVKAYVLLDSEKYAESRYLACLILNDLKKNLAQITSISVIPVSQHWMNADEQLRILSPGQIGVVLEIGNMQLPSSVVRDKSRIVDSIQSSLRTFEASS